MKNEKLLEATMLALRGKLLEEVDRDFEKVLDYINGDYHRVEDFTDLEICYPNEEDTDWLDAYDVANELLNKLSKEDWATMAKEIDNGTLRDKLTDWGMKAGSLNEARSHKEDNEKVAPRGDFKKAPRYVKNSPYNEPDVPKRAKIGNGKPDESGSVWGLVDKDLVDTYEKSTPDIERYKEYKADAERERDNARYYNKLAKRSDDLASDIVRDKKLDRAKRNLNGQKVFNTEESKK